MQITQIRLRSVYLHIGLICLSIVATYRLSQAASPHLVWKPYLQQLTDTSVIILWTTQTGRSPEVRYSVDTSYGFTAVGSTRNTALGTRLHKVTLTELQPNTTYYYKVYVGNQDLLPGDVLSFQTAPSVGSDTPFTFVAFGDYGTNSASQKRLRDQMLLDSFNFILTTGDNAYPDGTDRQFDANVFQLYQDLFSKAALFPALGNHDYHTDNGAPYLDIFDLPQNAWRTGDVERYYSFNYGNGHFVVLDFYTLLYTDDDISSDDMLDWLRSDLSQTEQRWKIVALHTSAYTTGYHGPDSRVRTELVPIFEAYNIDLVLSGHNHIYQRSQPLRGGQVTTVEQSGIIYIVSGAGSAASYTCSKADWVAISYCSKNYGLYTRITVTGNQLTIEAIDDQGIIKDYYRVK